MEVRNCTCWNTRMATNNERYVDYLDFSALCWKRPESQPRIWRVVDGRRKTATGEIPRFSIQEVPEDLENDVIDFMAKYHLAEEPTNVDTDMGSDPLAVRELRTLWRDFVHQGVSVVALTVNSDPTVKPAIAGVNLLKLVKAAANSESLRKFQSKSMKKKMKVFAKFTGEADVLRKYGIDKYLGGFGLCVHPVFRGQGLGEDLLRTRDDIGLAYQLPVSSTLFTSTVSQVLATRVGFEVLLKRKYSEFLDDEGKVAFPSMTEKFIKIMGKRLYS